MVNFLKYILLYAVFVLGLFGMFHNIDNWHSTNIEVQQHILVKQAQTHFNDQINTRKWNSQYGGVFVKQVEGQEPNPFLKNSTLKVNDNLTLLRINPALMTRELSELSDIEGFSFRITSLTPINPKNVASGFETRALKNFENTEDTEYYEFKDSDKFRYMGALITTESCLACHNDYKLGEIEGGISVTLSRNEYNDIIESLTDKVKIAKISLFLFLSIITLLIHRQFDSNINLLKKVKLRTKEIEETKKLLQNILDADKSFLLVSDGKDIIFANKTALDLAGFSSLVDFEDKTRHISDKFEKVDNPDFLQSDNNGLHWIPYLQKEQNHRDLKVLIKKDGESKYLKPHSKEISVDNILLHLITFDDITDDYLKIKDLTTEASTDPLTGLFNRRKLNGVLSKEIELSSVTKSPLSIIFLDIDHFKGVNDTFGHDVGDEVLIDLSKIITSTTRKGDFIARWGGEEFMIALQATDDSAASYLAEKIKVAVEAYSFNVVGNITISLGITQYIYGEDKNDFTKRVDKALYEAKDRGRNRVVIK